MARRPLPLALILSCCLTFIQAESTFGYDPGNRNGDSIKKPQALGQRPASIPLPRNADSQIRLTPSSRLTRTLGTNTDASKPKQAVHLNTTSIDASYRWPRSPRSGVANRLRAIRNSELLITEPQNPASTNAIRPNAKFPSIETPGVSPNNASKQTTNKASTTTQPRTSAPTVIPPPTGKPLLTTNTIVDGEPAVTDSANEGGDLPSVMNRQTSRVGIDPLVKDLEPALSAPGLSAPGLSAPGLSAPGLSAPRLSAPRLSAPRLSEPALSEPAPAVPIVEIDSGPVTTRFPKHATQEESHVPDEKTSTAGDVELEAPSTANPVPFTDLNIEMQPDTAGPRLSLPSKAPRGEYTTITPTLPPRVERIARRPDQRMQLGSQLGVSTRDVTSTVGEQPRVGPRLEDSVAAGDAKDNVLLSNRSPVVVVKTHGSPTIKVGRIATYTVTASNIGDLLAEDVEITVDIPSWAEVTLNQASAGLVRLQPNQQGHSDMRWTISRLDANTRQQLRVDFVPRISRPIDLRVTWKFKSVFGVTQIQVLEPKLQMSVVGPPDIQYNDTKLYTITVSNPGSGDAENVVLTLLPISDGRGNAGVRELRTIKAGARRTVEVELTARQAGELVVRATAAADGGLHAQGEQRVRVRRANLEIEAVGPTKKYAGTEARYAIKISNTGDATANDVVATAALPMAARYTNSSIGGTYDAARGKVRWSIRTLQPGAFQIVELSIALMGEGQNRLDVRTSAADQLTATGSVTTDVQSLADLKLLVNDPKGAVAVGTEMVYEIRIVNRGTKAAHNVNVVGYFSEGIEPVAVRGWQADIEVGQVVFQQIPRIAPGQEMVVKVAAQASRPGDHVFRTELDSNDPATRLAVEEWTRFYGDDIDPTLLESGQQHATAPQTLPPERLEQRR